MRDPGIVDVVRRHAIDVDIETAGSRLLDAIDPGASLVLIGESTHGTHDFYRIRANLTRALVEQLVELRRKAAEYARRSHPRCRATRTLGTSRSRFARNISDRSVSAK